MRQRSPTIICIHVTDIHLFLILYSKTVDAIQQLILERKKFAGLSGCTPSTGIKRYKKREGKNVGIKEYMYRLHNVHNRRVRKRYNMRVELRRLEGGIME